MKLCSGCLLEWPPEAFYEPRSTECKGCISQKRSRRYADPEYRERHNRRIRERRAREKKACRLGRTLDPRKVSVKASPDGERFARVCPFHGVTIESVHVPHTAIVRAICPKGHEVKVSDENNHGGATFWCWDVELDRLYAVVKGSDITIMAWREKAPEISIDSVAGRA